MAGTILTGGANANGAGYAVNDTGFINQGGNMTATYLVTAVGGDTELASVTITSGGSGYTPELNVPMVAGGAQPGGGSGGTFNISTVGDAPVSSSGYQNRSFGGAK